MKDARPAHILVIKLGAQGDFVQAMGAFKAIRAHHGDARITLLTPAMAAGVTDTLWEIEDIARLAE